jgi:hypothetical protein
MLQVSTTNVTMGFVCEHGCAVQLTGTVRKMSTPERADQPQAESLRTDGEIPCYNEKLVLR